MSVRVCVCACVCVCVCVCGWVCTCVYMYMCACLYTWHNIVFAGYRYLHVDHGIMNNGLFRVINKRNVCHQMGCVTLSLLKEVFFVRKESKNCWKERLVPSYLCPLRHTNICKRGLLRLESAFEIVFALNGLISSQLAHNDVMCQQQCTGNLTNSVSIHYLTSRLNYCVFCDSKWRQLMKFTQV